MTNSRLALLIAALSVTTAATPTLADATYFWRAKPLPIERPAPAEAVEISDPGPLSARVGRRWELNLGPLARVTNADPATVAWRVEGAPASLALSVAGGVLSGTPTAAGSASFDLVAAVGRAEGRRTVTMMTSPAPSVSVDSVATLSATMGRPWSFDFAALTRVSDGDGSPTTWSQSGMPAGLSLNPATGLGSGTPTAKGQRTFSVVAAHGAARGSRSFTIVVEGQPISVTQVSAGTQHTCAVTTAGAAMCWGHGSAGRLGNGGTADSRRPVEVSGLGSGVASVAVSNGFACALTTGGAVRCWGFGLNGELGNGGTASSSVPVPVSGLGSGVRAITVGDQHACAITSAGAARCWGTGSEGKLGNGDRSASSTPVPVTDMASGVTSISAGSNHTCAIRNGAAYCWGWGSGGRLGVAGGSSGSSTPVPVSGLGSGMRSVSAGISHNCAVSNSGAASCWGNGEYGQLGGGVVPNSLVPTPVQGLGSGVSTISVGEQHTCATTTAGDVRCWGAGHNGQLGNGLLGVALNPTTVSGLSNGVASVSSGSQHTCAAKTSGELMCWGRGDNGRLGDGGTASTNRPNPVMLN